MSNDVNYFLRNPKEAEERFNKRQTVLQELINDLTSKKDKSEFEGMYREMRDLNEQFNKYYLDVIVARSNLEDMEDMFKKDEIDGEGYNLQIGKNKTKLVDSLQKLIDIDTKIKEISENMVKVAAVEKEIKSVQVLKEREEPREEYIKKIQKIQNDLDSALLELKWTRQQLNDLKNNIMKMEDSTIKKRLLGIERYD